MITSHGYPTPPSHHEGSDLAELKPINEMRSSSEMMTNMDQFSPHFGDEEFDIPPINIPQSALEDQNHPQHYYQHPQHQQQMMQQQQMYHQHWSQQSYNNMSNGYQYQNDPYAYGNNYGGHMYQQQQQPQMNPQTTPMPPGGPSPVGSHNTPSPQSHSEDGTEEQNRNNNILKRPPEQPMQRPHHTQMMSYHHPMHHHHAHHHHHPISSVHVNPAKKPKVSKRKKKRDPNEPQKPVSAYALFFRDSQASIKAANPNAAFGDVSKIVASMWDGLDPDNKAAYKKRTENAKKDYLKKLAAYRASLVSKGSGDASNPYYGAFAAFETSGNNSNNGKPGGFMTGYMQQNATPPVSGVGGVNPPVSGATGQPIPPRPPMQQQHQQHPAGAAAGGGYIMHHGQQVMSLLKQLY